MDSKLLPNRRQITIAIMKNADLDRTMSRLREKLGDEAISSRDANVVIGSMFKHITDTAFYLGRTIARTLDPDEIKTPEDFIGAVEQLKEIMELTDSFIDGVKSKTKKNDTYDFLDIVDGLDIDFDAVMDDEPDDGPNELEA